jgi:hypothetical protein
MGPLNAAAVRAAQPATHGLAGAAQPATHGLAGAALAGTGS